MPLINGRGCTANAALRISSAFVGAWVCLTRKAGRFAIIFAQQGAVCWKLNMPDVRQVCVSFDGDFYIAAFVLERGFAGVFHDGNVGRRAFYGILWKVRPDRFRFCHRCRHHTAFCCGGGGCRQPAHRKNAKFRFRHCTRLPNIRQISAREPLQAFHAPNLGLGIAQFGQSVGCRLLFWALPYPVFISFGTAGLQFD